MAAVTVSDIRREIWRAAGAPDSDGAGAEAGRLFHLVAGEALGGESAAAWQQWFDESRLEAEDAAGAYAAALYEHVLGPALEESARSFEDNPQALVRLWNGVKGFAGWLVGLLRECRNHGLIQWQGRRGWQGAESLVRTELPLTWRVSQPDWKAPVEVRGTLDALFRDPSSGRWIVVEWKLASSAPEADAAQLCLYHRMLEANGENGAAALVSFDPGLRQTLFDAAGMRQVQERLVQLIGKLAGVAAPAVRRPLAPLFEETAPAPRHATPEHLKLAEKAIGVLRARGHDVSLGQPVLAGPSFLQIPVRLAPRASVRRVMAEAHDLQVQLGLKSAPILRKGEGCVLLEIPRPDRETVFFRNLNLRAAAQSRAPLLIGVDLAGRPHFADLADSRTPHLLVAGSTGSGKSEWMRAAIAALMATHTPADLRLVLIDPKRTAFPGLRRSPYLWDRLSVLMPPDDDMIDAFDVLIEEMESRYRGMEKLGAADLSEWKSRDKSAPPRIVVLCDEYADLVQSAAGRKELENRIARLGAKARAAGIHLVLATQRASRDVVTGVIKANLTGRVCLRVAEPIESRLVLNAAGAENLTGHGDLLWSAGGEPVRLQAPLLDEESRSRYFVPAERQAGGGAA